MQNPPDLPDDSRQRRNENFRRMHDRHWRDQQRQRRNSNIRRIIAVLLIISPVPLFYLLPDYLMLSLIMLPFAGAILLSRDANSFITERIIRLIWPDRAPEDEPVYGIARSLAARGKFAEAEEEYEKILEEYPTDVRCHVELITIAVKRMNDSELAEALYLRGMEMLHKHREKQEELTVSYNRLKTMLKTKRDTEIKRIPSDNLDRTHEKLDAMRKRLFEDNRR